MRHSIRFTCLFFSLFLMSQSAFGQELYAMSSDWDDSFREWTFVTADEEEGTFGQRWLTQNDWTEWNYSFNNLNGTLRRKWDDNPNHWELRTGGSVINIVTKWRNDFTEWRVSKGTLQLTIRSRYTNNLDEWVLRDKEYGNFSLQSEWEKDPRDWNIYDELAPEITMDMKLAMCFISIISSVPRL